MSYSNSFLINNQTKSNRMRKIIFVFFLMINCFYINGQLNKSLIDMEMYLIKGQSDSVIILANQIIEKIHHNRIFSIYKARPFN